MSRLLACLLLPLLLLVACGRSSVATRAAESAPPTKADDGPMALGSAAGRETVAPQGEGWTTDPAALPPPDLPEGESSNTPPFLAQSLDGQTFNSTELYGKKPLVLIFWATWCGPCIAEIPTLKKLHTTYGDQVQFLAISVDAPGDAGTLARLVAKEKLPYPVIHDVTGKIESDFGIEAYPTNIFFTGTGLLVERVVGLESPQTMESLVKRALGGDGVADSGDGSIT